MDKINTGYERLEKFRLNCSKHANREVAPVRSFTIWKLIT